MDNDGSKKVTVPVGGVSGLGAKGGADSEKSRAAGSAPMNGRVHWGMLSTKTVCKQQGQGHEGTECGCVVTCYVDRKRKVLQSERQHRHG